MQPMLPSVSITDVQDYWDARPCNVRHGVAPVGTLEWSRQVTSRKYMVEPHIPEFAQFERWRGKRVLEVGCGIGTDTLEFVKHGATVDAVDVSPQSVALAYKRQELEIMADIRYGAIARIRWGNAEISLPKGPFDLVYSFGVLHHTPHPLLALDNMYRSLRPGGELRIMLYAARSLKFWLGEQPEAQAGCPVAKTYTADEAWRLLRSVGFEGIKISKAHIFPWRVKDYVEHRYVRRWPYRLMPSALFERLEKLLGHHLLIVARRPA